MPEDLLQSLQLIALPDPDELLRHGPFRTANQSPEVPGKHQNASNDIRLVLHLISATKNLKAGMAAKKIILLSPVQHPPDNARVIPTSSGSMMETDPFVKSPGLPSLRLRAEKRDQIDPPRPYRLVTSYILKTFAAEHLTGA